jgi:GT2 family glycosyltransferase
MKLTIVIVNYNVKYFLEHCLHAVSKAIKGVDAEVFVVDNNSVDGSVEMLQTKFPQVRLIANKANVGFSKANNQAIHKAEGEYILLLNPDTVVEEDTFRKVLDYMDHHEDTGGLGVKMVDGKGKFLPESKRSLPTPSVAFYKIFGLSGLFPKSKTFGKYHLGYLHKDEVNEVEVLSGAFMLLRKKVLDQIGLLDETFFMYGEDIDLSYRILKAGYKNIYFPETRIIHYKGESTKKSSVNYVVTFYKAMIIFARKHFSTKNASTLSFLINAAIYFRALLSITNRFLKKILLPLTDTLLLAGGLVVIKNYWEHNVVFPEGGQYPLDIVSIALPIYMAIWIFSVFMSGGYDRPLRLTKLFQGLFIGTVIILTIYALLPEFYRFSRAIILLGGVWGLGSMVSIRIIFHVLGSKRHRIGIKSKKRFIIAGDKVEAERVAELIRKADMNHGFIGLVSINKQNGNSEGFIGHIDQIKDIINIYKIDEVIFCAKDLPARSIIDIMADQKTSQLDYKIAPPESLSIIGSQSINTSGDIYILELDSITKVNNRRSKRFFDILFAVFALLLFPVFIFIVRRPFGFFTNIVKVLISRKSWVGYCKTNGFEGGKLPKIKKGILNPTDVLRRHKISAETINKLNLLYARDYKLLNDMNICFRGFRNLGRKQPA